MSIIYSIFVSIYIALGASCTGDLARLQHVMKKENGFDQYEPGSKLFFSLANFIQLDISATIVHFFAVLVFLLSLRYFFLKTGLLNSMEFYLISFLVIFNPLTFQLVSSNTRQLLFISIFSIPFYRFIIYMMSNLKSKISILNFRDIKTNKFLVYSSLVLSFFVHTSSPIIFIFLLFYFLTYFIYKIFINNKKTIGIKLRSKISAKTIFLSLLSVGTLLSFGLILQKRLIYLVSIYTPSASDLLYFYQESNFGFDYTSPGLMASVSITLLLILYSIFYIPKQLISFKILNITLVIYTTFMILFGINQPFLSTFLSRTYQPILLIVFPLTLIFIFSIMKSRYKNLFAVLFLIICLGWQTLKLGTMNSSDDTFYSVNNKQASSCAPFRAFNK